MSYHFYEIKGGRKLSEMTEDEQKRIRQSWDDLCAREDVNTSEYVFFQKANGRFLVARRGRIGAVRGRGSRGGCWYLQYGDCRRFGFTKDPFGTYYPEAKPKYFSSIKFENGETVEIPRYVHTKKDVLELAKKIGFIF